MNSVSIPTVSIPEISIPSVILSIIGVDIEKKKEREPEGERYWKWDDDTSLLWDDEQSITY